MFTGIARCETVIVIQDVINNKPEFYRKNYQGLVVINQTIVGEHLLKVCILFVYFAFYYYDYTDVCLFIV